MYTRRIFYVLRAAFFFFTLGHIYSQESLVASQNFDDPINITTQEITSDLGIQSNLLDPFSNFADHFGITDGLSSGSVFAQPAPGALIDNNASSSCPSFTNAVDGLGVLPCDYGNNFFGIVDTENGENAGPVRASFKFDVSATYELTRVCVDLGAMGDFEAGSDYVRIEYEYPGSGLVSLFEIIPDESISEEYFLTRDTVVLNDPMTVDDAVLNNGLTTFCRNLPPGTRPDEIDILIEASLNGGSEALALDNISIFGSQPDDVRGPQPNCIQALSAAFESDGSLRIPAITMVTNLAGNDSMVVSAQVRNSEGTIVSDAFLFDQSTLVVPNVCDLQSDSLIIWISNDSGSCATVIRYHQDETITLFQSLGDTTVWCFDELVTSEWSEDSLAWYMTHYPFTRKPVVEDFCGKRFILNELPRFLLDYDENGFVNTRDTLAFIRDFYKPFEDKYELELIKSYSGNATCNDTLFWNWSAVDKLGTITTVRDTIHVMSLPLLHSSSLIAPKEIEVYCTRDTSVTRSIRDSSFCWKIEVGLHNDSSYIAYPVEFVDSLCAVIDVDSLDAGLRYRLASKIIYVSDKDSFGICDLRHWSVQDGEYIKAIQIGDQFYSGNDQLTTVNSNFFYSASQDPKIVDVCLPLPTLVETTIIGDVQFDSDDLDYFFGLELPSLLDNSTYDSFYFEDPAQLQQCGISINFSDKEIQKKCPRRVERNFEIKQYCTDTTLMTQVDSSSSSFFESLTEAHFQGVQNILFIDEYPPVLEDLDNIFEVSLKRDCEGVLRLPSVRAVDKCGFGVAAVKASIDDHSQVPYKRDAESSLWVPEIEEHKGVGSEVKIVTIVVTDSCGNQKDYDYTITADDFESPLLLVEDTLRFPLNADLDFFAASSAAIIAEDNCGPVHVFARRKDWDQAGVDLCSSQFADFDENAFNAFFRNNGYFTLFGDERGSIVVERFYLDYLRELELSEHPCRLDLLQGWSSGVQENVVGSCNLSAGRPKPISLDPIPTQIGGGWLPFIPILCSDACEVVDVEVLVLDQNCNHTLASTAILVEDKRKPTVLQELSDISLACRDIGGQTKEIIRAAINLGNSENGAFAPVIFRLLDRQLGGYSLGRTNENGDFVDDFGAQLEPYVTYQTTDCRDTILDVSGPGLGITTILDTLIVTSNNGIINSGCGQEIMQQIEDFRDECGIGKIVRKWHVSNACDSKDAVYELIQTINIYEECPLSQGMVMDYISDTTLCFDYEQYPLEITLDSLLPQPKLKPEFLSCRNLGYFNEDRGIRTSQNLLEIHRKHKFQDWCTQSEIQLASRIRINKFCESNRKPKLSSVDILERQDVNHHGPQMTCYPNPTYDGLTCDLMTSSKIEGIRILDAQGSEIMWRESGKSDQSQVRLNGLDFPVSGVYFVIALAKDGYYPQRVVVYK